MSGKGGDHELDVAAILKRAREPAGLAELRRAIESLGMDEATRSLAQILEVVHDTRQQLAGLARAIEKVADGSLATDHLVDTTPLDTYTVSHRLEAAVSRLTVAPPDQSWGWFHATAIAVKVLDADGVTERFAELDEIVICDARQELAAVPTERLRAPPGRGHPVTWRPFSDLVRMSTLNMTVRMVDGRGDATIWLTLSGSMRVDAYSQPRPQYGRGGFGTPGRRQ